MVAQGHGLGGAFQVDPEQLGLASHGGRPLPNAVRGKMEAALGADFSAVRVHVGPQAERIGAAAFTLGTDIYFAPGRFQPDTVQGQQLLGHELAHVVQQRAGRVRHPMGAGVAVVQDWALEAEAERLGHRAAAHRIVAQPKTASGAMQNLSMPMGGRGVTPWAHAQRGGRFVQRKVGFEFEFPLPLSRYLAGEEAGPNHWDGTTRQHINNQLQADMAEGGTYGKAERVRGHVTVVDRSVPDGWRVTADNTTMLGSHKANLEVVTIPFDTDSWSPLVITRRVREAVRTMRVWIDDIVMARPQTNRVRIPGTMYVVGFPPLNWPIPTKYNRGVISTDAYVQINIGVPLNKVSQVTVKALGAGNQFKTTELEAPLVAKKIVQKLTDQGEADARDALLLEGFFTLLMSAIYGAKIVDKGLLKKLWSLLPKTGLAAWWKSASGGLSVKCKWKNNKRDLKGVIEACILPTIGMKKGQRLLAAYEPQLLVKIAKESGIKSFERMKEYTVGTYIFDVMSGSCDPLAELALQHKTVTGGGTSRLGVDTGRGQTLGVLEIRNINTCWPLVQIEQKALEWAKYAYDLTGGNWDLDLAAEQRGIQIEHDNQITRATTPFQATKAEMLLGRGRM
jgi:hypothetical protein